MLKTAARSIYEQYAGYGQQGYHPGLDDPRVLGPAHYQEPKKTDEWPDWAVPSGMIAGGILGALALKGLGGMAARRGKALLKRAPAAPALPPPQERTWSTTVLRASKGLGDLEARNLLRDRGKALLKRAPAAPALPPPRPDAITAAGSTARTGARGAHIAPEYAEALAGRGLAVKTSSIITLLGRIARQAA
jgi:hypothetical protein